MDSHPIIKSSYRVSPNIALIKYWGKYDEDLILALNSSFSLTLSEEDLYTETTVEFSANFSKDSLILNGEEDKLTQRLVNVIKYFRDRYPEIIEFEGKKYSREEFKSWNFKITSTNNFPTAAGLASSSSGIACLVVCLQDILKFKEEYEGQISEVARIGSGSASRSIYGGGVIWKGVEPDLFGKEILPLEDRLELSKKCVAKQLFGQEKFKDLEILILIARSAKKDVPSTSGMNTTVKTSELLKHRIKHVVEERMKSILEAIEKEDWHTVFEITMRDSNNFHSVCLDTYPPIFYLNSTSQAVIKAVTVLNEAFKQNKLGYTFDAGANAVLFIHNSIFEDVARLFANLSGLSPEKIDPKLSKIVQGDVKDETVKKVINDFSPLRESLILENIMYTRVGKGPIKI